MKYLSLVVIFLCSCHLQPRFRTGLKISLGGPQPPPMTWEECKIIDRNALGWTATAVVFGILGGSSGGLTSAFDETTSRYITGSIAVGLSVIGALGGFLGSVYSKRYAEKCTSNTGGK